MESRIEAEIVDARVSFEVPRDFGAPLAVRVIQERPELLPEHLLRDEEDVGGALG